MKYRILLQARTSSSRLPGKSLLPIGGVQLAVLCAMRLSNTGMDLIGCTSSDSSDDLLAQSWTKARVAVHRGSLEDVLGRFVGASADMDDNDVLIRCTADNAVPDGHFIEQLLEFFNAFGGTNFPHDFLPYGVAAEIMRVRELRAADAATDLAHDREHVTPWIYRNRKTVPAETRFLERDFSHLRMTIDTLDDYLRMESLFASCTDPINIRWDALIAAAAAQSGIQRFRVPLNTKLGKPDSRLCMGTVQLGMDYGVANRSGQPSLLQSVSLVHRAIEHGVNWFDTASTYGEAERVLGRALKGGRGSRVRVVTKLDSMKWLDGGLHDGRTIKAAVEASVYKSMHLLGREELDVVTLHRPFHLTAFDGEVWRQLVALKWQGLLREAGASVYTPEEAMLALEMPDLTHLQIPFNLLDTRWLDQPFQESVARRPDVRIHARSVYLQGLLVSGPELWPAWLPEAARYTNFLDQQMRERGFSSRAGLCLSYAMSQPWIDAVVFGCETEEQLDANLTLSTAPFLDSQSRQAVINEVRKLSVPQELLNPVNWKKI